MEKNLKLVLLIVVDIVSLGGGYYYGNQKGLIEGESIGVEKGKVLGQEELLAEQQAAEEEALQKIQDAANIYSDEDINPYADAYQNPFAE